MAGGQELCTIESSKAIVGVYAPVSGQVAETNAALEDDPGLINLDPYGRGWICRITLSDPGELSALMDAAEYERFCQRQKSR